MACPLKGNTFHLLSSANGQELWSTLTNKRTVSYTYDGLQRLTGALESPGTSYAYGYDLAGNRTSVTVNGTTSTTSYNAANQVIGLNYDAAGNLLGDGTTTYGYDALNRTTARGSTTYSYNGDGVLVSQAASGVTTRYTQDLAAPLSQILSDGSTTYLYGLDRLATQTSGVRTWYVSDALGSVRRTVSEAGVPLGVVSYDPWGTVESGSVPTFGFTGELQQGGAVYLRARWYNSAQGRFGSVDPFAGAAETPYSLHPYQYAYADPVLSTDPAGTCAVTDDGENCHSRPLRDPRDLTFWLYQAMIHDSTDPRLLHVRYLMGFPPLTLIAPCPELTSFLATRGLALSEFRELVKDHGPWDVKHKIRALLGQGVTYCGSARCRKDVEYSVAGNILYGFVGRAGSIPEWLIGSGAGYAEASDPAHDPERAKQAGSPYVGPYDPTGKFGSQPTPFGPIQNRGDDPQDNLAVHFGVYLYDAYGKHMTYTQFLMELTRVLPQLATQPPDTGPVRPDVAKDWPYNAAYFNWP